jgi:hypothetical protein
MKKKLWTTFIFIIIILSWNSLNVSNLNGIYVELANRPKMSYFESHNKYKQLMAIIGGILETHAPSAAVGCAYVRARFLWGIRPTWPFK